MQELMLTVPTYYGAAQANPKWYPDMEEFDEPSVPVLIREAEGVRIVLGTTNWQDFKRPDVQIERRPNGWAIFLRPDGGDANAIVYFLDDGRSFLLPDGMASNGIEVLSRDDEVRMIDEPPLTQAAQNRFGRCPELSAAWIQAQVALRGDSNDGEHDALLALVQALESVELAPHESTPSADAASHIVVPQTDSGVCL